MILRSTFQALLAHRKRFVVFRDGPMEDREYHVTRATGGLLKLGARFGAVADEPDRILWRLNAILASEYQDVGLGVEPTRAASLDEGQSGQATALVNVTDPLTGKRPEMRMSWTILDGGYPTKEGRTAIYRIETDGVPVIVEAEPVGSGWIRELRVLDEAALPQDVHARLAPLGRRWGDSYAAAYGKAARTAAARAARYRRDRFEAGLMEAKARSGW